MKSEAEELEPLDSSVKLASEYIVPGGSNLVEGDFVQGGVHAVLGLVARSMFGLPGLILVSANSFTKATTGRHIHEHLGLGIDQNQKERTNHQGATPDDHTEIKASASSKSAYSAAKRRQPSSKKRPSSSKTNGEI